MHYLTRACWLVLALVLPLSFAVEAVAQSDLPVYTDHLQNGFEDWGWVQHSYTNTAPVHSGKYSLSVKPDEAWSGIFVHHAELDTRAYANLSFWVHGGNAGGQLLRISAKLGTNDVPGYELPTGLPAGKWQQFVVPLEVLGVENRTNFTGFLILARGDSPLDTFYFDDIRLGAKGQPAPNQVLINDAPAPPPAGAAVNSPALGIWICGALGAILLLLIWLVVVLRRGAVSATRALVPVSNPPHPVSGNGTGGPAEPASTDEWRQRALAAEAVASKQGQILREKLVPELAEMAKSSLVQGLASQRNSMLETQRLAENELAELEARLAELQLPLRDRILVYEKRIAELEKELVTRSEEMRELVSVTLSLIRQRLAQEKKKELAGNGGN